MFETHHQEQNVTGDGHVERLESVDGGEGRQLDQRVRVSEDTRSQGHSEVADDMADTWRDVLGSISGA